MSVYEYKCSACDHRFERTMTLHEHEEHKPVKCPNCDSRSVKQLPSSCQIVTSTKAK